MNIRQNFLKIEIIIALVYGRTPILRVEEFLTV